MWSFQSFLNPKIGQQKLAHKSKIFIGVKFSFFQNVMNMAAAVGRLNFSQSSINEQALSCLPGCSLASLICLIMLWWNESLAKSPEHHHTALLHVEGHCRLWNAWGEVSHPKMHLQLCWHGKMQHQWPIYFLKQSLAALIGHVMIIRDTIHGFVDMCFLEHPKY